MKRILCKDSSWILLLLVLLTAFLSYFLTVGKNPPGLTNDEVDIGYEAFSISQTARDQWGNFLPVQYFSGFGGTRLPLVVYWTVPFIKILGMNAGAVRWAGAAAGILAVAGFWLLLRKVSGAGLATLGSLVFLLTPWFWGLSRITNEAVLALGLLIWGIWAILVGRKKRVFIWLAAILLGLSCYAYYSSQIFVPVFLLILVLGWRFLIKEEMGVKLTGLIILGLLVLPILWKSISGGGSATRLRQTGITGNVSLVGELNVRRSDCLEEELSLWCRVVYNKPSMWLGQIGSNYIHHFSSSFLFEDSGFVGVIPPGGAFFWVLAPGLLGGLYGIARGKIKTGWLWIAWLLAAPVADSLTSNGHYMRSLLITVPIVAIGVLGWREILSLVRTKYRWALAGMVVLIFVGEVAYFLSDYQGYFPKRFSVYSHYQYQVLFNKLLPAENNYSQIYISNDSQSVQQYAFYLFYSRFDPTVYQKKIDVEWEGNSDGWIWVKRIGKWNFIKSIPPLDQIPLGSLVVGNENEIRQASKLRGKYLRNGNITRLVSLDSIKLLSGDTAFITAKIESVPLVSLSLLPEQLREIFTNKVNEN